MANKSSSQRGRARTTPDRIVPRPSTVTVDVVLLTPVGRRLGVLLVKSGTGRRSEWSLPWGAAQGKETLEDAAGRIARSAIGTEPQWLEQISAFGGAQRHPAGADVSVAFVGVVPTGTETPDDGVARWFSLSHLPAELSPRHKTIANAGFEAVRARLERSPVAFRLLPATFTLSELQHTYEVLLGRRLHKASFRRALQSAGMVGATGEWRSEGRGRPAQLFRYAPKKQKGPKRGIRF